MRLKYNEFKITIAHKLWRAVKDNPEYDLDYWTVRKIIGTMGELIEQETVDNTDGFQLPYFLGNLQIVGYKRDRKKVSKWIKLKIALTENYVYAFVWDNRLLLNRHYCGKFWNAYSSRLIRDKINKKIREDDFHHWIKLNHVRDWWKIKNPSEKRLLKLKSIYDDNW